MIAQPIRWDRQPAMTGICNILILTIVTTFAGYGCHSKSQDETKPIKLYYVSIGVETLVPVTSDEMEEKGRYCKLDSVRDVERIRQILNRSVLSPAKTFSDKSARVKLIDKDDSWTAFVDNYGGLRLPDGKDGRISATDMQTLKHVIESQCRF